MSSGNEKDTNLDYDTLTLKEQVAYLRFLIATTIPSTAHGKLAVKSFKAILARVEAERRQPSRPPTQAVLHASPA